MQTCCPQYAIRLPAALFKPSKSQRSCLRKFTAYLENGTALGAPPSETDCRPPAAPNILTIETRPAECTDEIFALYKAYQVAVHGDKPEEITPEKFSDFLVFSALPIQPAGSTSCGHRLGTHHQLYRIDGRLVAVGVLDILPSSLSSVYCFYDPALKHLALGKFTALREIQYCADIEVPYYCMGFYIQSCPKMNYKGDYSPSELLCPTTQKWFPLSACKSYLEAFNFTPLDPEVVPARTAIGDDLYFAGPKRKRSAADAKSKEKDDSTVGSSEKTEHDARMDALFGPRTEESTPTADEVPLTIPGAPGDIYVGQLRGSFQRILRPIVSDFARFAGSSAKIIQVELG